MEPYRGVEIVRVRGGRGVAATDRAATEEPLEVRLHGRPFAVIMRTPGADRELAAGFLLSERVLKGADDLGTIEHCRDETAEHPENIVNVTLANGSAGLLDQLLADRRQIVGNSSCGMCGRLTIASLRADTAPVSAGWTLERDALLAMPGRLRSAQAIFDETGGLHAAGLFSAAGALEQVAEDVGRHNAVDKIIGRMLMREALPLDSYALFVSGRASYEIVQKAAVAGIPIVASVSAPSTLAIDLALETGVTLVGFVRDQGFNVYSHSSRITV